MTKRAAVIGYPIKHSLSPVIHNYWLKKYNIDGIYEKIEVKPEELAEFLEKMKVEKDFVGCNVTVPHKEAVYEYLLGEGLEELSVSIGAVNTIFSNPVNQMLEGYNTDAIGFVKNIDDFVVNNNIEVKANKAVVIGAGGAARAVVAGLVLGEYEEIIITNRTLEKAEKIKEEFCEFNLSDFECLSNIKTAPWKDRNDILENANLLVNTTILGMEGQQPLDINLAKLPKEALVNDIVYKPLETELLKQARLRGNKAVDGLGMLLYQAVEGFEMWFGVKPEVTDELRQLVLDAM